MQEKLKKLDGHRVLAIILAAAAVIACIAGILIWRSRGGGGVEIKEAEYLAGGTIPADAKVYPIMSEDMPMIISGNSGGALSDEDIWTITHYVDLFASLEDTDGLNYNPDAVTFLSTRSLDEILANNQAGGDHYTVNSVQILALDVEEENRVQVAYVVQLTGGADNVEEGDYVAVNGLFFKRVNGNWYEDGIGFYCFEPDGTISIDMDTLTGEIIVNYI